MAELPFLVVHGAWVWKASVVGAGLASLRLGRWRRDRKSAAFVRRATGHYIETATGLEAGPILVRGILRGGGATSYEHSWHPVVHARDAGTYVDIEGERIDFDGEVVVGCGTENRTGYLRAPAGTPAASLVGRGGSGAQRLSIVREGDEVLISGILSRVAVGEGGEVDYREGAATWRIAPFPRQGAIGLVAKEHRARAMPVGPLRQGLGFGVVAVVSLIGMATCGAIESSPRGSVADKVHKLTIAAAMPGSRKDALTDLEAALTNAPSPDRIDQAIALRELRKGCNSAIDLMIDFGRYTEARDAAHRCDLPSREAEALMRLGRFEEASHIIGTTEHELAGPELAALAAGDFDGAARVANDPCERALFSTMAHPGPTPSVLLTTTERCALLATQLAPPSERAAAVAQITVGRERDQRLAGALFELAGGRSDPSADDLDVAARDLIGAGRAEPTSSVWTSRPGDVTPARAVYEVLRGRFDRAQAIAGALVTSARPEHQTEVRYFAAMIALRAGKPIAQAWLEGPDDLPYSSAFVEPDSGAAIQLLRGKSVAGAARGGYTLDRAIGGDGSAFVDSYAEIDLAQAMAVMAVLPKVTTERQTAIDYARAMRAQPTDPNATPMREISVAAMRRDLARATGDAESATDWQAVIDRHFAVLDHPERLAALLITAP